MPDKCRFCLATDFLFANVFCWVWHQDAHDPSPWPNSLYNSLGRAYLTQKSQLLAVAAFEKALEIVRNDGFALSGLVEAHNAVGDKEKAREAYARLLHVWSDAEPEMKWLAQAKAVGLQAQPKDVSPGPQRNYKRTTLAQLGAERLEAIQRA